MWNFGSWKTFSEQLKMYETNRKEVFVISNVPYSRCDYFFSSEADLINVFSVLDDRCQDTNNHIEEYADNRKYLKDIYIIIDEAHRYFDSRSSLLKWNNLEKMNNVLTQCRKRNIRIVAITQRLTMIDIRFRRLSDYVEEYKRWQFLGFYWVKHSVYENRWDLADIETDNVVKISSDWEAKTLKEDSKLYSELFKPLTFWFQLFCAFDKAWRSIKKESYNTYYICALEDSNVKEFNLELFKQGLLKSDYQNVKESIVKKSIFRETWFKSLNIFSKVWSKIKNLFNLDRKGSNIQEFKYPLSFHSKDYQVKKDLYVEKENV